MARCSWRAGEAPLAAWQTPGCPGGDNGVSAAACSYSAPGDRLVACDSPAGRLGLSTCYDLRFPGGHTGGQMGSEELCRMFRDVKD